MRIIACIEFSKTSRSNFFKWSAQVDKIALLSSAEGNAVMLLVELDELKSYSQFLSQCYAGAHQEETMNETISHIESLVKSPNLKIGKPLNTLLQVLDKLVPAVSNLLYMSKAAPLAIYGFDAFKTTGQEREFLLVSRSKVEQWLNAVLKTNWKDPADIEITLALLRSEEKVV